jgi:hypothetical protein
MQRRTVGGAAQGAIVTNTAALSIVDTGLTGSGFPSILLRWERPDQYATDLSEEGYTPKQIGHHVWLLSDAGFLLMSTRRLTHAGQELVDTWRSDEAARGGWYR